MVQLEFPSVCACCVPGAVIGALITAWVVFASSALFINAVSTKGTRLRKVLNVVAYSLTAIVLLIAIALGVLQVSADARGMFFAKLCSGMSREPKMGEFRCNHVGTGISGRVLEIGPGPGTNFQCWGPATESGSGITEWVGVEPNNHFEPYIAEQKTTHNITFPTSITWLQGEDIAVEPESFDFAVGTHVLCSVSDVDKVLAQVSRALKPGGVYYFMEHVATDEQYSSMWYMQQAMAPFLLIVGNGCEFKHLGDMIQRFNEARRRMPENKKHFEIELRHVMAPVNMPFIKPHIIGKLTKLPA